MTATTFTTEEHWRFFSEFCRWEMASGGPDPQLPMVAEMVKDKSLHDRVWAALCYIAPYNVPYGEVIWNHFPWSDVRHDSGIMIPWLDKSFADGKITTRVERRCVRRPDWMAEYFAGAREFVLGYEDLAALCSGKSPEEAYVIVFDRACQSPRIGRYVAIKLVELLRLTANLNALAPDIRPRGAWSPRVTLMSLLPHRSLERKSDDPAVLQAVHSACLEAVDCLGSKYNISLNMFQLQVLLCEYRESWEGRKQYPGRSLDSELGYARRAEREWGHHSAIWEARRALFPLRHLGEIRGWDGPRKPVAEALAKYHYTWTDLQYDYSNTTNFAEPVRW